MTNETEWSRLSDEELLNRLWSATTRAGRSNSGLVVSAFADSDAKEARDLHAEALRRFAELHKQLERKAGR